MVLVSQGGVCLREHLEETAAAVGTQTGTPPSGRCIVELPPCPAAGRGEICKVPCSLSSG